MQFAGSNFYTIVLAAVAGFVFGAIWYTVLFSKMWLRAVGKTPEEMKGNGPSIAPFVISFVSLLIMAWVLAGIMGHVGALTVRNGLISGAFVWLGFVATTLATNDAFRGQNRTLTLIDGVHWLGVLLIQGAIIGFMGG